MWQLPIGFFKGNFDPVWILFTEIYVISLLHYSVVYGRKKKLQALRWPQFFLFDFVDHHKYMSEVKWVMRESYFLPNTIELLFFYFSYAWWILLITLVPKAYLKRSKHFTIRTRDFLTWEDAIFNPSGSKRGGVKSGVSSLFISIGRPSGWDIWLFPSSLLFHWALLVTLLTWTWFKERLWMDVLHVRKENQSKKWKQSPAKFKANAYFYFYHLDTWSGGEAVNYLDNCIISLTLCNSILNYKVFYFLSINSSIPKLNWNK